jgi:polyisoprenyl-phosphate glycosyltransferase
VSERPNPFSLTIVVPFFNEGADSVAAFVAAVVPVVERLTPHYEIVTVDDGSSDDTLDSLTAARDANEKIKVVALSRNYGHQLALTAGLNHAAGDAVIAMDGDLQDPPEVINTMIDRWRDGVDVVYGQRERRDESVFKRAPAALFYKIMGVLGDHRIPADVGDFRLMDRRVVDALNTFPERNRFLRGLVSWMGFRQEAVTFVRPSRASGDPKYTVRKSVTLAANGLFSFSRKPLRLATWLGLTCSASAFLYLAWVLIRGLFFRNAEALSGWYALSSVVLFLGGIQLTCLGLIGEYVGRIYEEVKGRPLYLVRERHGLRAPGLSALPHTDREPLIAPSAETDRPAEASSGRG